MPDKETLPPNEGIIHTYDWCSINDIKEGERVKLKGAPNNG